MGTEQDHRERPGPQHVGRAWSQDRFAHRTLQTPANLSSWLEIHQRTNEGNKERWGQGGRRGGEADRQTDKQKETYRLREGAREIFKLTAPWE